MTIARLHVENDQFLHRFAVPRNQEVLALVVIANVQSEIRPDPSSIHPTRFRVFEFHSRTHLDEGTLQDIHFRFRSKGLGPGWGAGDIACAI
jgi:cytochrome P450